jgi:hypothetical protein
MWAEMIVATEAFGRSNRVAAVWQHELFQIRSPSSLSV